ncbi:MAG: hypothetical protein IJM90_06290 [Firmicutes bacterium]|nr:hypothetical protein [Bacillota bacterium]
MKSYTRVFLNALMLLIVPVAWSRMLLDLTGGDVRFLGLSSLRMFTILSNLLEAAACGCFLRAVASPPGSILSRFAVRIKYTALVTVTLTFLVTAGFLGPVFGYRKMFSGVSFWLHLVVPVIAIVEWFCFEKTRLSAWDNLVAVMPISLYGIYYLGNILINGVGSKARTNDWYGFFRWGIPIGVCILLGLLVIAFLLGLLYRKVQPRRWIQDRKKASPEENESREVFHE